MNRTVADVNNRRLMKYREYKYANLISDDSLSIEEPEWKNDEYILSRL